MRKLAVFLFLSTTSFFALQAQIKEAERAMSQGNNNAFIFSVPEADENLVADVWKEFVKDEIKGKVKYDRKSKEYFVDDADIKNIGQGNTFDIYAMPQQKGTEVDFIIWFDLGGAYLSKKEHGDRYSGVESLMMKFGVAIQKEKVKRELDAQEKLLKDLENELKKLANTNEKYHKIIEKAKEEIAKAEADIQQNLKDQELAQEKIESQKQVVEDVKQKLNKI